MDIVERLRKSVNEKEDYFLSQWPNEEPETKDAVRFEAADEIEDLRRELDLQKQRCELWKENSVAGADEIERLREALKRIAECEGGDIFDLWKEMRDTARSALQQKDSE